MSEYQLQVIHPDGLTHEFPLEPGRRVTIGRDAGNDLVLSDPSASRFHAVLDWSEQRPALVDLNTANGTDVDGQNLHGNAGAPQPLAEGSRIRIGNTRFVLAVRVPLLDMLQVVQMARQALTTMQQAQAAPGGGLLLGGAGDEEPAPPPRPALQPGSGVWRLYLQRPDRLLERVTLTGNLLTVGSAGQNDLCLDEPGVSVRHLNLVASPRGWEVMDMGSEAGTLLNGAPVPLYTTRLLADDDRLTVGSVELLVRFERWVLQVAHKSGLREERPIDAFPFTIGRASANSLQLCDGKVAEQHARLVLEAGRLRLIYQGRAEQTAMLVDHAPVLRDYPALVDDQSHIQICDSSIVARLVAVSGRPLPASLAPTPASASDGVDAVVAPVLPAPPEPQTAPDTAADQPPAGPAPEVLPLVEAPAQEAPPQAGPPAQEAAQVPPAEPQPEALPWVEAGPEVPSQLPSTSGPVIVMPLPAAGQPAPPAPEPPAQEPPADLPWVEAPSGRAAPVNGQAQSAAPAGGGPASAPAASRETASLVFGAAPDDPELSPARPAQPAPAQPARQRPPAGTALSAGTADAAPEEPDEPAQQSRVSRLTDVALDQAGKLPTLVYWRLRLVRWLLTGMITLFGLNKLRSWFSRWLGFIPGPLQGLDNMDRWLQLTDPARLRTLRGDKPAPAAPSEAPAETTIDVRGSVPGARQGDTALAIRLKTLNEQYRSQPLDTAALEQQIAGIEMPRPAGFVTLGLSRTLLAVDPGQIVSAQITVCSQSAMVERLHLRVIGLPEAWLTITPSVSLLPRTVGQAELEINPPRHHSSLAGAHFFVIEGCAADPSGAEQRRVLAYGVLLIAPFSEFLSDLRPNQQPGWRDAVYNLVITNNSNHTQEYLLEGRDDDELMSFAFAQARVMVQPGKQRQVRTTVRVGRWHWFGMQRIYLFQLKVSPVDAPLLQPLQVFGRFVQHPLLTLLTIIGLLLLLAVCAAPLALRLLASPTPTPTPTAAPTTALPTATPTLEPTATPEPTLAPPTLAPILEPTPAPPTAAPPTPAPPTAAPPTATPPPPTATPASQAPITVRPGQPVRLPVSGPANLPFLIYFDGRVVGGGSLDAYGRGEARLQLGAEDAGVHTVTVRERGTWRLLIEYQITMPPVTPTPVTQIPAVLLGR